MIYANNEYLQDLLFRGVSQRGDFALLLNAREFHFADVDFAAALAEVKIQHATHSDTEAEARAAYRLLTSKLAEPPIIRLGRWQELRRWSRHCGIAAWPWVKIVWALAVLALLVLLAARPAHGQVRSQDSGGVHRTPQTGELQQIGYRTRLGHGYPAPDVPGGIIIQVANQGTVLATRPAGLLKFDCGANMTCSFSGVTFSMTAGAGGAVAWSGISAPTADLSLAMVAWKTTLTWNAATGAGVNLFNLTDTLNNTGSGFMLNVNLASGSAMKPAQFAVNGNGITVSNAGLLGKVGTGGLDYPSLLNFPAGCGANNWITTLALAPTCAQPGFSNLSGSIALGQTQLTNRGDLWTVNSVPALIRLGLGGSNLYPKSNGSDLVYSTLGASGIGACTNQFWRTGNADAAPTCNTVSLTADVTGTLPLGNGGTNATTAAGARSSLGINYTLQWNAVAGFSPLASTNYFWPNATSNQAIGNTQEYTAQIVVPQAGTVSSLTYSMAPTAGTAASAGSVTFTLRLNGVNTAITGTQSWSGISTSVVTTTATGSVTVALGDLLSVNTLTPAWTTAPTAVRTYATVLIAY